MTETALGLSKLDLAALRQADRVSFHFNGSDPVTYVNCSKEVKSAGPFEERERVHRMTVKSQMRGPGCNHRARCSAMVYGINEEWKTLTTLLRAGDVLTVIWYADANRNGYLEHARITEGHHGAGEELHADTLSLQVQRGAKRLWFHVLTSICPHNSARMIQTAQ